MNGIRLVQQRHAIRRLIGVMLSMIHLHRVEFISIDGVEVVRKQRRAFARWIIPAANLFLQITKSPFFVLPETRWLEWERSVASATQRMPAPANSTANSPGLWSRQVPGVSLGQILASRDHSPEQKFDAIRWSLFSLRLLHQNTADWGDGIRQSISHGDATANNVIVDVNTRTACWIDFDTRHRPDISAADRQTDDLRALIDSIAVHLTAFCFPELADALIAAGFEDVTVQHFRQRLTNEWRYPTVAQLAQSPLRWSEAAALRSALLHALAVERAVTR